MTLKLDERVRITVGKGKGKLGRVAGIISNNYYRVLLDTHQVASEAEIFHIDCLARVSAIDLLGRVAP